MRACRPIAVLTLLLPLAACVQAQGDLSPGFGTSTSQTRAAQVADPDAAYARETPPASAGERTVGAQQRYNSGRVTPVAGKGASGVGSSSAEAGSGARR
ncbi:MAG: hypothetical protein ACK41C_19390 [Phenylobacterium sp.]|jgi:hypothetical protein|uniref:hypothetical protein n=1 Tax=Phenylobacterium sp. TaxID=1871053 RepID=UPI00391B3050